MLFFVINVNAQTITPIAGNGTRGYSGDGGPATQAQLDASDIALDNKGNLYIADTDNNRIRKVDVSGIITTVAGSGQRALGDGGLAIEARLGTPSGVFVDGVGNIFIADRFNHRIRKVDTLGIITTVAGTGAIGYSGDGGLAIAAQLNWPSEVWVDGVGTLFIMDVLNHCIRKVDTAGVITTIAGTGKQGYSGDGGLATHARLNTPRYILSDPSGNIYFSDVKNDRIRKIDTSGVITTIAGTGQRGYSGDGGLATRAQLNQPRGLALDRMGNLFFADGRNNCIRMVDTSGNIFTVVGISAREKDVAVIEPISVAIDANDNIYFFDKRQNRVLKVSSPTGAYVIRQHQTHSYLLGEVGSDKVKVVDHSLFQPDQLQFVWNIMNREGHVVIQNVGSRKFIGYVGDDSRQTGLVPSLDATGQFTLMGAAEGSYVIVQRFGNQKMIVAEDGKVVFDTLENSVDAQAWELVRLGPVQNTGLTSVEREEDTAPLALDGKHVVLDFEGYMYRLHHEGEGDYRVDPRRLGNHNGWLAASEPSSVYQENEVFTLEYVGTWAEIFHRQNAYALSCRTASVDGKKKEYVSDRVYVLKTKTGIYIQPEGFTSLPIHRGGDSDRPIVHLSVGAQGGIRPDYPDGTLERDKAALFVVETSQNMNATKDGVFYVSAVSHQWHQPPSLVDEIKNFGQFLPVWGIVAPINLYTLQACHNMQSVKPWPQKNHLPQEHWLTTYPLGVSVPLNEGTLGYSKPHAGPDHFRSQICFTNTATKDRAYNPYLGITTGWWYGFGVEPRSQVRLQVLDDDLPANVHLDDQDQAFLR